MTTLKKLLPLLALVALAPAAARADGPKTVNAFAGRWVFDATFTMGQSPPAKLKLTNDCQKTALGKAVVCRLKGKTPAGPMEASFLIGYDELAKAVHFMSMTSDGEVHDHVCRWKGDDLGCDRLKGGMGPMPITEDLSFRLEGGKLRFESVVTTEDGTRITFAGVATRR